MQTFGPTTGYLWLDSWILANIVQLGTQQFCKKFLRRENDPTGRQFDQMTHAARCGSRETAIGAGLPGLREADGVAEDQEREVGRPRILGMPRVSGVQRGEGGRR